MINIDMDPAAAGVGVAGNGPLAPDVWSVVLAGGVAIVAVILFNAVMRPLYTVRGLVSHVAQTTVALRHSRKRSQKRGPVFLEPERYLHF